MVDLFFVFPGKLEKPEAGCDLDLSALRKRNRMDAERGRWKIRPDCKWLTIVSSKKIKRKCILILRSTYFFFYTGNPKLMLNLTFQVEQLEQKTEKRHRTKEYRIVDEFSGSWFPVWSHGCKVAIHPPCTDEPRIPLQKGDTVKVTRWKRFVV